MGYTQNRVPSFCQEDEVVLEEEDVADQAIFNANNCKKYGHIDVCACFNHMTGDREKFKNVEETLKSQVRLGDDKEVQVEGNRTVVVTLQGRERFIPDVQYAP
nr:putative ribonuclease H-like domain-containing protein [Tanacetum cinerariifolium]